MSLKTKYSLGAALIVVAVVGVLAMNDLSAEEGRIKRDNTAKLSLMTKVIKNSLIALMLEGRGGDFQQFVETLIAEDISAVRLYRPDGTVLSSSIPQEKGTKSEQGAIANQSRPDIISFEKNGHLLYSMRVPIFNERPCQRCHGTEKEVMGVLDVEIIMDSYYRSIRDARETTLFFMTMILLSLGIGLGLMTKFLVVKPLKGVMETIKSVEEGDLKARFVTDRRDEIGELGRSLNSMLSELNRARQEVETCHLESMQKVEKMATIGELASAIAHEIKNPLAGISGAIQVFAEDFPEKDPRRGIISEVLSEIERLDKAVRDLLSFARPPEPHRIKTFVMPVVERAIRLITPQAKKQGVDISTAAVDDICEVYTDPEQMQQVFLNIMLNALQSMPGGGRITVTTYFRADSQEADVIISDTGHGISQADIKNIFKPFFTTKHMGTGLGLAISKTIAEKNGGRITVESQIGAGSSFRVTLPAWVENA